jgi:hypothetical protein
MSAAILSGHKPQLPRHDVLAVDQHAVKRHDERRGPLEVQRPRHEEPILASGAAHSERLVGELALFRAGGRGIHMRALRATGRAKRGQRDGNSEDLPHQ